MEVYLYFNEEGVLCKAIAVRFALSEEAFTEIKKRADSGDEMAKLIVGGVVDDKILPEEDEFADDDCEED